jgi:hypothetical protein
MAACRLFGFSFQHSRFPEHTSQANEHWSTSPKSQASHSCADVRVEKILRNCELKKSWISKDYIERNNRYHKKHVREAKKK